MPSKQSAAIKAPRKSRRPAAKVIPLPKPFLLDQAVTSTLEWVTSLRRLDALAQYLTLHGAFCVEDPATLGEAIESVAVHETKFSDINKRLRAALETLSEALEGMSLPEAAQRALFELDDLSTQASFECGEAGYLLGVAVGLRLSPEILNGGVQ